MVPLGVLHLENLAQGSINEQETHHHADEGGCEYDGDWDIEHQIGLQLIEVAPGLLISILLVLRVLAPVEEGEEHRDENCNANEYFIELSVSALDVFL